MKRESTLAAIAAVLLLPALSGCVSRPPGAARDGETADELRSRAVLGDAAAAFEYARLLETDGGEGADLALAAYWYEVAEEQGYDLPPDLVRRIFP